MPVCPMDKGRSGVSGKLADSTVLIAGGANGAGAASAWLFAQERARPALPGMLEPGYGVIVNTSSSGVRAATPLEAIYCASKAAMHQLARAIAVEYRDHGIRCNTLCPSFVRTRHGIDEIA